MLGTPTNARGVAHIRVAGCRERERYRAMRRDKGVRGPEVLRCHAEVGRRKRQGRCAKEKGCGARRLDAGRACGLGRQSSEIGGATPRGGRRNEKGSWRRGLGKKLGREVRSGASEVASSPRVVRALTQRGSRRNPPRWVWTEKDGDFRRRGSRLGR